MDFYFYFSIIGFSLIGKIHIIGNVSMTLEGKLQFSVDKLNKSSNWLMLINKIYIKAFMSFIREKVLMI